MIGSLRVPALGGHLNGSLLLHPGPLALEPLLEQGPIPKQGFMGNVKVGGIWGARQASHRQGTGHQGLTIPSPRA